MSTSTRRSEERNTSTRFRAEPKTPERTRSRSTSRRDPPDPDDDSDLDRLYKQLFGKPALGPSRERVFYGVYELTIERLMDAKNAVEAARSEFYRGDHPFDYEISESAGTVGGPVR